MSELTWLVVAAIILTFLGFAVFRKRKKLSDMTPAENAKLFVRMGLIFTVIGAAYSFIEIFFLSRMEPVWDNALFDLGVLYLAIGLVWMRINSRRAGKTSEKTGAHAKPAREKK